MENISPLQTAAFAVCETTARAAGARGGLMVALRNALSLALVAQVNGKAVPFQLRDYAFHPAKGGKRDQKLRSAQLTAIMVQGCGQPEGEKPADALKTAFAETFPAAIMLEALDANIDIDPETGRVEVENMPVAYAFSCFNREGAVTETGKAIAAKVAILAAGFNGQPVEGEAAIALLHDTRINFTCGVRDLRFDTKCEPITNVIKALKQAAIRQGLVEDNGGRAPRAPSPIQPSEVIKSFETFLAQVRGDDDESEIALNEAGIAALKALKASIDATIKAIA